MNAGVTFHSSEQQLTTLLSGVHSGKIQLPDFQRDWVWDDERIRGLLASVSMSYPVGTLMLLDAGNEDVRFASRPIQGVTGVDGKPGQLILDGQQRLTTLYQVLQSKKPVQTFDARKKRIERWYYFDIPKVIDPSVDREDAIVAVGPDRIVRDLHNVKLDLSTRENEWVAQMLPADLLLDGVGLMKWQLGYFNAASGEEQVQRQSQWAALLGDLLASFAAYLVPVIMMTKETPRDAVCQVFEKVNTGGVTLNVFELLTATYAADHVNLRDRWAAQHALMKQHPVLEEVESTDYLQAICLLASLDRRQAWETTRETDRAPAVTCKRRDILRLPLHDYLRYEDAVTKGFLAAGKFLLNQNVFGSRDVPYRTQLVPLAALLTRLGNAATAGAVHDKLVQWYWCGVFGELYGSTIETRFANDLVEVLDWVSDGPEPTTVTQATFQEGRLHTMRSRQSAAYKGLHALLMRDGAQDFKAATPITIQQYVHEAVDIHHVFPQRWCKDHEIDKGLMDSIVNKAPLSAETNREVGGRAPSAYLTRLERTYQLGGDVLDQRLVTHVIDPALLRADDFHGFFRDRKEQLVRRIEAVTGKRILREAVDDEPVEQEPAEAEPRTEEELEALVEAEAEPADGAPDRTQLEREFHLAMLDGYRRAKSEAGYHASYFVQSVQERGGLATARALLRASTTSDGFTALYLKRRLDLTVEAYICDNPRFAPLFSADEIDIARYRLREHGYVTPEAGNST